MKLNLVGSQYQGRSLDAGSITCQNLYPEKMESEDTTNEYILIGTPGQTVVDLWDMTKAPFNLDPHLPARCQYTTSWGNIYVVYGNRIYCMIAEDQLPQFIGIIGSPLLSTPINAMDNGTTVVFVDGFGMYATDRDTFTIKKIDLGNRVPSHIVFQGGYLIVNNLYLDPLVSNPPTNTQCSFSNLFDAYSWPLVNTFVASGSADPVTGLGKVNDQIWAMGEQRYELFTESGDLNIPIQRFGSSFTNTGLIAPYSICTMGSTIFWVGVNVTGGITVFRNNGIDAQRISTHAEEYQLSRANGANDVQAWVYSREGHDFVVFTSNNLNLTIVWDNAEGKWHRRTRHNMISTGEDRYAPVYASSLRGVSYCCTRNTPKILKLDLDTYTDYDGTQIVREHTLPIVQAELQNIVHDKFILQIETGYGEGNPQATLFQSDDAGHTWSVGADQPIGTSGEFGRRITWWRRGMARLRQYKIQISAPIRQVWIAAYIENQVLKGK